MLHKIISSAFLSLTLLAGMAHANEASVKKSIEARLEAKVTGIKKLPYLGLYEVQLGNDIIYTDDKSAHIIVGNIIDTKTKRNLTQEQIQKLSTIKFSDLPLEMAVKTVIGNGQRVIATFEDPNCGYCKKLAKELQGMKDITIYTFMTPILSADSADKVKAVWCAPDRSKAWFDLMTVGTSPAPGTCEVPTEKVLALSQKLGVRGTPAIFFSNGDRTPGFITAAQIEEKFKQIASAK